MIPIRPIRATDIPRLTGLLAQLGYPSDVDTVADRLTRILSSPSKQVLVAAPEDDSRLDGCISLERRLTLIEHERVEITGLVVDSAARRSGIGRALVEAGEAWALQNGIHTVLVRSSVARAESHPFYEGIGYQRTKTSHVYHKEL